MEKNIRIDELLWKKGKTKAWLEEKTGASHTTISNLVNNKTTSISFKLLRKICYHLECSPNEIFTDDYRFPKKGKL